MNEQTTAPTSSERSARRGISLRSPVLKMVFVLFLVLLLLIPLAMVRSVIQERQRRYDTVLYEVSDLWGRPQTATGPVLTVPYRVTWEDRDGKVHSSICMSRFLPETLSFQAQVLPEVRNRGIYEVVVYRLDLSMQGEFRKPDLDQWQIAAEDVLWEDAYLSIGITDPRGIREGLGINWQGEVLDLEPGTRLPASDPSGTFQGGMLATGVHVPLPGLADDAGDTTYPFSLPLELNGSRFLGFMPLGKVTRVELRSPWPDPSFSGAFLPVDRDVRADGFDALWEVSYFGRSYPQSWREIEGQDSSPWNQMRDSVFGVELLIPVDLYQKTERSVKYAVLFLLLTFLGFFLFEVFRSKAVHPFQYLLVGCALCLFYLLLLSLSEHVPFALAYGLSATATIGLIYGYARAILDGGGAAALMAAVLIGLYGYLYVLLQVQDFALLLGSLALFLILAVVMYITRRIDWYGLA